MAFYHKKGKAKEVAFYLLSNEISVADKFLGLVSRPINSRGPGP